MEPTLPVPDRVVFTAGTGTGTSELVALDRALADAGIENGNLLSVSSVIPAGATVEPDAPPDDLREEIVPGGLYPVVYAEATVAAPADAVHAAVAGCRLDAGYGVNVETAGPGDDPAAARAECERMLDELAATREEGRRDPTWFEYASAEGPAGEGVACAVAAAVYL